MNKKYLLLLLCTIFVLSACSNNTKTRKISVFIPQHPWEEHSGQSLWYMLRWTDGDEVNKLYVDNNTREVQIEIPVGETVIVTASPLGEMAPFGTGITPLDTENRFVLDQNRGRLAEMLINQEGSIRSRINFSKLSEVCCGVTDDFRRIDEIELLSDILNGSLKKASVKLNKTVEIPSFSALAGIWISESSFDDLLFLETTQTPVIELCPGIHRYYCVKQDREIRITVDYDGSIHATLRQALVPKNTIL